MDDKGKPLAPLLVFVALFFLAWTLRATLLYGSERLRFRAANVIASLLFALVHLPNWLWTRGFQAGLLSDLFGVFALALFLGYLLRATNALWSCVFAHVLNNFLASLLRTWAAA